MCVSVRVSISQNEGNTCKLVLIVIHAASLTENERLCV